MASPSRVVSARAASLQKGWVPSGLEHLAPSGLRQRQVQGPRGCSEPLEGSEDFCSPAQGLPSGCSTGRRRVYWQTVEGGGDLSKAGAWGAQGPATLRIPGLVPNQAPQATRQWGARPLAQLALGGDQLPSPQSSPLAPWLGGTCDPALGLWVPGRNAQVSVLRVSPRVPSISCPSELQMNPQTPRTWVRLRVTKYVLLDSFWSLSHEHGLHEDSKPNQKTQRPGVGGHHCNLGVCLFVCFGYSRTGLIPFKYLTLVLKSLEKFCLSSRPHFEKNQ